MAIVNCGHHSGMGLCSECVREINNSYERQRQDNLQILKENKDVLRQAANVFDNAGNYGLARLIREQIPSSF